MKHCKNFSVIWDKEIKQSGLVSLLRKEVAAVRIPNYYDQELCATITERLLSSEHYGNYVNAPKIARIGQAYFESQASTKSKERYEKMSTRWIREIREGCTPYLSPIDKLRLELDEVWSPGAKLGRIGDTKLFAGLARHFGEGSEAEPHTDVLEWDAPNEADAQSLKGQLATNTYLSVPEEGGELTLWDVWPTKAEFEEMRAPGSYGLKRELLPDPAVTIRPEAGELIIFNPTRVHAVEKIKKGSRVTWSSFVGFVDTETPLTIWS